MAVHCRRICGESTGLTERDDPADIARFDLASLRTIARILEPASWNPHLGSQILASGYAGTANPGTSQLFQNFFQLIPILVVF